MSPSAQTTLEQLEEFIQDEKKTDQDAREVQEQVDGEEGLDPDITSSVLNAVVNTINNEFEHEYLEEAVRLLNAHLICQSIDNCVPGHKYSIPGLAGTKVLGHQVWAIWFVVRRWVWDADMPGPLVADEMGLGMTFTSVTAAMINQLLTKKVVMGLQLSILWGNTLAEWENMVQNDFPGIISKERKWYPLRRHNSVPRLLIEIQKTPPQGRPALSFVAEPILVVTMPAVAETFKSVIDEMIFATDFQLINLWHAENVNLTHKDLNTSLDEPENRCSIHLVSYNTFLSRVKPSSNGQLSHCSWSFGIFDESHPSAKNISARVEWQRKSGQGPSEPSETPRWRITPCPASIPRIALHNTLRSPFNLSSRSFYVKLEEHRNKVRRYDTTRL